MRCRVVAAAAAVVLCLSGAAAAQPPGDPIARARALYNQGDFEGALVVAEEARLDPERADSADLIAARAYLERFRMSALPEDLSGARDRLRHLNPGLFGAGERLEFIVGLGEALFFENQPGAAATLFASALDGPTELTPNARERVLDWWASAVDADARPRPDLEQHAIYQQVVARMREELTQNVSSATAAYWLAAAARGQGDLQSAWDAALAGWLRAPLTSDRGASLRGDLDRLVLRAIVPERARMMSQPPERLLAEWEAFKERWNK